MGHKLREFIIGIAIGSVIAAVIFGVFFIGFSYV